ncbi:hypothetical protein SDC9_76709 [bioreactor metagenome]|uniref:Uncharacterized protein n=1 Tax=bioreactor metagenome TaxID=1076179 RepID=A0A644YVW1_9ZZZZ
MPSAFTVSNAVALSAAKTGIVSDEKSISTIRPNAAILLAILFIFNLLGFVKI